MENTRQNIFRDYHHIVRWIDSCFSTEQLHTCGNAIESFTNKFERHAAVGLFTKDLRMLLNDRHNTTASYERAFITSKIECNV